MNAVDNESVPDGATIYKGKVYTDPMDGVAVDHRLSMHMDRGQLPQQIKDRIDIVDLIAQDIELKKSGKDWQSLCPFHEEKTPSFTVSQEKQFYHCFGCGAHGDAFSWMQEYHRSSFYQALLTLGRLAGVAVRNQFKGKDAKEAGGDRRLSQRKIAEIEDALIFEMYVILQCLEARKSHRRLSGVMKARMRDIDNPPEHGEREKTAATRISNAIISLYNK